MVRQKALALGGPGVEWLAGLADLVAELERRWAVTVGPPCSGGSASYVARVRTSDGRDAVLKLAVPDPDFARQVRTIEAARGHGYVRMLAHDVERSAMLLEALGPSMDRLGLTPERTIAVLCATLQRAWQVSRPAGVAVPVEEKAHGLADLVSRLWEDLDRPCPELVVARALEFAARRAAAVDPDRCVIVHGDPHPGNALRVAAPRPGAESGYVFVDPDGFVADPAYDLGVVLRDWCPELLAGDTPVRARRYCSLLAAHSGVDAAAIWEWGFLERVSSGLYLLRYGAEDLGRPFLDTAERLV